MRGSRIKPDFGVLIVSALVSPCWVGRIRATPPRQFFRVENCSGAPRKDAPKAAQPSEHPTRPKPIATADVCDPATRNLVAISAALNQGAPQVQKTCATTASPQGSSLLVRPIARLSFAALRRRRRSAQPQ